MPKICPQSYAQRTLFSPIALCNSLKPHHTAWKRGDLPTLPGPLE